MRSLAAHGLALRVPPGWEGRIQRRGTSLAQETTAQRPEGSGAWSRPGVAERTCSVVHLANFALPEQRDDFGGGVTPAMRSADVFVVLFEYGPESLGSPLFASEGMPRVTADTFGSRRLQRPLPGQLGCQHFFTAGGRPFCLYVVAGSRAYLPRIVADVNAVLAGLDIQP